MNSKYMYIFGAIGLVVLAGVFSFWALSNLQSAREELRSVETKLAAEQEYTAALHTQVEDLRGSHDRAVLDANTRAVELLVFEENLADARSRVAELAREKDRLDAELADLQEQHDSLQGRYDYLQGQYADLAECGKVRLVDD